MTCSNIEKSFKGSKSIIILLNEFEDRFLLQQINNHFGFEPFKSWSPIQSLELSLHFSRSHTASKPVQTLKLKRI